MRVKNIPIPKHSLERLMLSKAIICLFLDPVPVPLKPLDALNSNSKSWLILWGRAILTRVHEIEPDLWADEVVNSLHNLISRPDSWYRGFFSFRTRLRSDEDAAIKYKNLT
jgi:hypothetical protein